MKSSVKQNKNNNKQHELKQNKNKNDLGADKMNILFQENEQLKVQYLFIVIIAFAFPFILFDIAPALLCNLAGFAYPAYASLKAIENRKNQHQWLIYWIIFSLLCMIDSGLSFVIYWIPYFYVYRFAFLLYLYLPISMGAGKVYDMIQSHLHFVGAKLEEVAEGNEMNINSRATVAAIAEEDEADISNPDLDQHYNNDNNNDDHHSKKA